MYASRLRKKDGGGGSEEKKRNAPCCYQMPCQKVCMAPTKCELRMSNIVFQQLARNSQPASYIAVRISIPYRLDQIAELAKDLSMQGGAVTLSRGKLFRKY